MGSGWVPLSPRQEAGNFKKLWLVAQVLGSFQLLRAGEAPGRQERERCPELWCLSTEPFSMPLSRQACQAFQLSFTEAGRTSPVFKEIEAQPGQVTFPRSHGQSAGPHVQGSCL